LWWLLCFFFREEADVLSGKEPKVFVSDSWDKLYDCPDAVKKREEDSLKRRAAWQDRKDAAQERWDYFSQWFSDDFLQRFLDVLLQRPSDDISQWLSDIAKGDNNEAVRKLCDDYFPRMVRLAQKRFRHQGIPEGAFDGEDAAIEAMYEFYEGMVQGKFPNISNREELRNLLFTINKRRVTYWKRYCSTQKRGGGLFQILEEPDTKNQPIFATIATLGIEAKDEDKQGGLASIPDKKQRTPEEELIAAEQFPKISLFSRP